MNTIDLDVQDGNLHFKISFERRINFIIGDSASGKTTLHDMIIAASNDSDITVISTYTPVTVDTTNYEVTIKGTKNAIIIVDDLSIIETAEFTGLVKEYFVKNNLWFLIMAREDEESLDSSKKLSFSINCIFKFVNRNNIIVNEKYYSFDAISSNVFDKVI